MLYNNCTSVIKISFSRLSFKRVRMYTSGGYFEIIGADLYGEIPSYISDFPIIKKICVSQRRILECVSRGFRYFYGCCCHFAYFCNFVNYFYIFTSWVTDWRTNCTQTPIVAQINYNYLFLRDVKKITRFFIYAVVESVQKVRRNRAC